LSAAQPPLAFAFVTPIGAYSETALESDSSKVTDGFTQMSFSLLQMHALQPGEPHVIKG
jgi:hypothetical protein